MNTLNKLSITSSRGLKVVLLNSCFTKLEENILYNSSGVKSKPNTWEASASSLVYLLRSAFINGPLFQLLIQVLSVPNLNWLEENLVLSSIIFLRLFSISDNNSALVLSAIARLEDHVLVTSSPLLRALPGNTLIVPSSWDCTNIYSTASLLNEL